MIFSVTRSQLSQDRGLALGSAVIALTLICLWVLWAFWVQVTVWEVSSKARVESRGMTRAISALSAGRVKTLFVHAQQKVHAGDILIQLDADTEALKQVTARAEQQGFDLRLSALRTEIAQLKLADLNAKEADQSAIQVAAFRADMTKSSADQAQQVAKRLKSEAEQGIASQTEVTAAQSSANRLIADWSSSVAELQRVKSESHNATALRAANLAAKQQELANLEGAVASGKAQEMQTSHDIEDRFVLRAPVDGVVGDIAPVAAGSYVEAGQILVHIVPQGALLVRAAFDPLSVQGRIRPGQSALMSVDGYPWAEFGRLHAVVASVALEPRDGLLWVDLVPDSRSANPQLLHHGLTGQVQIEVGRTSPASTALRALKVHP